jgi:hypothetical protein
MNDSVGYVGRRVLFIGWGMGASLMAAAVLAVLGFRWWWCSFAGLALVALADRLTRRGRRFDPYPWARGLDGERQVAEILNELQERGFKIREHIDTGFGDVDHVVIGPTGVFAVETKNWSGKVTIQEGTLLRNGHRADDAIRQAARGAIFVKERLSVRWVEAILVCPNAEVMGEPIDLNKVLVVSGSKLNGLILSRRSHMGAVDTARLTALLDHE